MTGGFASRMVGISRTEVLVDRPFFLRFRVLRETPLGRRFDMEEVGRERDALRQRSRPSLTHYFGIVEWFGHVVGRILRAVRVGGG